MTSNGAHRSTQELRAEIDHIRADLGATVQELATRVDVPARMRAAAGRAGGRARSRAALASERARGQALRVRQQATRSPVPWLAVAGGLAAVVAVVLVVRGRRR